MAQARADATDKPGVGGRPDLTRFGTKDLQTLAALQGVSVAHRFEDLLGTFWPEGETADEFISAVRGWREEGRPGGRAL